MLKETHSQRNWFSHQSASKHAVFCIKRGCNNSLRWFDLNMKQLWSQRAVRDLPEALKGAPAHTSTNPWQSLHNSRCRHPPPLQLCTKWIKILLTQWFRVRVEFSPGCNGAGVSLSGSRFDQSLSDFGCQPRPTEGKSTIIVAIKKKKTEINELR